MATFIYFIESPEAYQLDKLTQQHPEYLLRLIDCITLPPDPFLHNERYCYAYPSQAFYIMTTASNYRLFVTKASRYDKGVLCYYPYLEYLFANLHHCTDEAILLGYINKLLLSLTRKTPYIYEYFKDHQSQLVNLLSDDRTLFAFREFLSLFIVESTMDLYSFIKSMCIRALLTRVFDDQAGPVVYYSITIIYEDVRRALKIAAEDEKKYLAEISSVFEYYTFVGLLVLKITIDQPRRTQSIAKFLNLLCLQSAGCDIVLSNLYSLQDYFEESESSSSFMLVLMPHQLTMLKLFNLLARQGRLTKEVLVQHVKRILVYCSIYSNNSPLHVLFINILYIIIEEQQTDVFKQVDIVTFLRRKEETSLAYRALLWKICDIWSQNNLANDYSQEEVNLFVEQKVKEKTNRLANSKYYSVSKVYEQNKETILGQVDMMSTLG